jgi:hypothetical protein
MNQLVLEEELRHLAAINEVKEAGIGGVADQYDLRVIAGKQKPKTTALRGYLW